MAVNWQRLCVKVQKVRNGTHTITTTWDAGYYTNYLPVLGLCTPKNTVTLNQICKC